MPVHIKRLIAILSAVLLIAVGGANYLTDDSYYRFGHYRADAVTMLAKGEPQFQGSETCETCHSSTSSTWIEGKHVVVQCEVCHGAAVGHPSENLLTTPMDTVKFCTLCHEALPARPATQPQIVIDQHPFSHQNPIPCIDCHNPHSPALGRNQDAVAAAEEPPNKVPELVAQCASCHGASGQGIGIFVALAGKTSEYLATQLQGFRSGDIQGSMMNGIAASLSDGQILEVAEYYADLPAIEEEKR